MSSDEPNVLEISIRALETIIRLYGDFCKEESSKQPERSGPRLEFAEDTSRESGPDGAWMDRFEERISNRAAVYMGAAREHLAGLQVVLTERPFGLTVGPAARSAMEASGKCMWLISHELPLGSGTRSRVARLLFDEEADARSRAKLLKAAKRENDVRTLTAQRKRLTAALSSPGLFWPHEFAYDKNDRVESVAGQVPPRLSNSTYRSLEVNGSPSPDAAFTYSYLSDMTHSTYSTVMEMANHEDRADGWITPWSEDSVFCGRAASAALVSFLHGWESLAKWMGVQESAPKDAAFEAHSVLDRSLPRDRGDQ